MKIRVSFAMLLLAAEVSYGAIQVGFLGTGPLVFDTPPSAGEWSTLSIAGASGSPETFAGLDAVVQALDAGSIAGTVEASAMEPPATRASAQWNSSGHYLQTRPTGNSVTLLMATLQNDTGANVYDMFISYEYQQRADSPAPEAIPGHQVYYSLSGVPGSWVVLGNFGAPSPASVPQPQNIQVSFDDPWRAASTMFILFADDNSVPGPEAANSIDNFAISTGNHGDPVIVQQPINLVRVAGAMASFSVIVFWPPPLSYQWFFEGAPIPGATSSLLVLPDVQSSNAGIYTVTVANGVQSVSSSNAVLVVLVPPGVSNQPLSRSALVGETVSFQVIATGTAPFTHQWRFNDVDIPGATGPTLTIANAQFTNAGNYSVFISNSTGTILSSNAALWFLGEFSLFAGLPIHGPSGARFEVQYTTNLDPGTNGWSALTNLLLPSNPYLFVDPTPARTQRRFYRVVLVP